MITESFAEQKDDTYIPKNYSLSCLREKKALQSETINTPRSFFFYIINIAICIFLYAIKHLEYKEHLLILLISVQEINLIYRHRHA